MAKLILSKPITIGNEEVVIVRDVLGSYQADKAADIYALVVPEGVDGRPAISVSENDLTRLRDDYPGIKVFGLWQLLFYNNLIALDAPLITFPLSDSNGLYILTEPTLDGERSTISSGEYLNGYIPDNYDVDLATARVLSVDLSSLRLPTIPALTRIEQSAKLRAENKRRWMVVGAFCALVAVATAAANYGMQTYYKSQMADYSTKKTLVTELEDRVSLLSRERLLERPNDSAIIDRLIHFLSVYPKAVTPPIGAEIVTGFTGQHSLITSPNAPVDPATFLAGADTELLPTLAYVVTFGDVEEQEPEALIGEDF